MDPLFLLAQTPPAPATPTEWWVPLIAALLVAVWDILKRKFNLVEPIQTTPAPVETPPPSPVPVTPSPSPTPVLDIVKQILPLLIPLLVPAIKQAMKDEGPK